MHDLVDAYSRAVAEATERAREKRGQAGRLFDDALDAIGADFQADVAAAGMALEVGMQARAAGFRGENVSSKDEEQRRAERESEPYADDPVARTLADRDQANARLEFDRDAEGRPVVRTELVDTGGSAELNSRDE